jgi:hypothetical protein
VNNGHVCVIRFGCAPSDDRVDLLSVCTHIIFMKHATAIVAAFLIFAGVMAISVARYNRKYQRHFENPTIEFFFRY